jgi:predicted PurR-regulated permease PerM
MLDDDDRLSTFGVPDDTRLVFVVRIICLGLLAYWSFILTKPFLTIIVWSVIIAVAIYPAFDWLSGKLYGRRRLAAAAITAIGLVVILGPATWLGLSLAESTRILIARIGAGSIAISPPREAVKAWPLIGDKLYELWQLASISLQALLLEIAPQFKSLGTRLLGAAGNVGINLLKFVLAAVISGFLLIPGPTLVQSFKNVLRHVAAARGEAFVDLAGATIRNVSRGVIGIAILQALLAGIGLLFAGIPAAGLFSFLVLLLGIVQIGPSIVLIPLIGWVWLTRDAVTATLFTAYMVPVNLIDNVLRPLLLAKGLSTPIPVILVGVIGGTLAHGMIGLFVGPIVLSIAWQLLVVWTDKRAIAVNVVQGLTVLGSEDKATRRPDAHSADDEQTLRAPPKGIDPGASLI